MARPSGAKRRPQSRAAHATDKSSPIRGRAKKVSLTVDEVVLQAMKHEARRTGRTLSAEVSEALARELQRRRLHDLIVEYEADHGVISAEELSRIQAEWQD